MQNGPSIASEPGVEVFNVIKRTRQEISKDSQESSEGGGRGRAKVPNNYETGAGRSDANMVVEGPSSVTAQAGSSAPVIKTKRLRAPPRKLVVPKRDLNTWEKLDQVAAPISFKDWIVNDKAARKQLKDGIRYLDARKPRKGKEPANPINVNLVGSRGYDSDTTADEYDSPSSSEYDDSGSCSLTDEERSLAYEADSDDDTVYDYPYRKVSLESSSPLSVVGTILGHPLRMVIDTGASVSVMDKSVAERFNLIVGADTIPISTIETTKKGQKHNVCHVTSTVPIRVGGKLRPEHFVIKDDTNSLKRSEPVVLLGMTWLKQYDIKVHAREGLVEIPVKNGGSSITIQGDTCVDGRPVTAPEVFCVSVLGDSMDNNLDPATMTMVVDQVKNQDLVSNTGAEVNFIMPEVYHASTTEKIVPAEGTVNLNGGALVTNDLRTYIDDALESSCDEEGNAVVTNAKVDPDMEEKLTGLPESLAEFLRGHKLQFAEWGGLGCLKEAEHSIVLKPGVTPVRSRPYRLTWEEDKYLRAELKELLRQGVLRPSRGEWCSPIFFVRKPKSKELRLVYDLRQLNQRTVREDYPIPNIHDLLDGFHGAKYFSVVDAASGFTQIRMAEDSIKYTGIITKYGTFESTRMPFGVQGGPMRYSQEMAKILGDYLGVCFQIFIDDICVYSQTLESHIQHLKLLFDIFEQFNLKLKWSKCDFAKSSVEFLGHVVDSEGIRPTKRNVQKLLDMPPPVDVSGVKSFLATANFYRRAIKNAARIALPLTGLLKKGAKFVWGIEQETAFNNLKNALADTPLVSYPDPQQTQILTTDGSTAGLGVILSQSPDGSTEGETVIGYASRTLRGAETRYSASHVEAFTVVWVRIIPSLFGGSTLGS